MTIVGMVAVSLVVVASLQNGKKRLLKLFAGAGNFCVSMHILCVCVL
jgi:hypothetical protein